MFQDALRSSLEASIIPAFEMQCKAMFEQIDGTLQNGLIKQLTTAQQQYDSTNSPLAIALRVCISSHYIFWMVDNIFFFRNHSEWFEYRHFLVSTSSRMDLIWYYWVRLASRNNNNDNGLFGSIDFVYFRKYFLFSVASLLHAKCTQLPFLSSSINKTHVGFNTLLRSITLTFFFLIQ